MTEIILSGITLTTDTDGFPLLNQLVLWKTTEGCRKKNILRTKLTQLVYCGVIQTKLMQMCCHWLLSVITACADVLFYILLEEIQPLSFNAAFNMRSKRALKVSLHLRLS